MILYYMYRVLGRTTNIPVWLGGLQCDFFSTKLSACGRNDASIGFATTCDQRNTVQNRDATLDCDHRSRGLFVCYGQL